MSETELAQTQPSGLSVVERMLSAVIEKGDVAGIETIVKLYREEQDRAAVREFAADFAEFQRHCPPVPKSSTADIVTKSGAKFSYSYAQIDAIAAHVGPELFPRGFSYSWDSSIDNDVVRATITLRHRNGHSITASHSAPIDASGAMSPAQKAVAALSYAKRQTLIQVLGLTTTEPDTDVRPENLETISRDQIDNLRALLADTKSDVMRFFTWIQKRTFEELTEADYRRALAMLEQKALAQRGKA